MLVKNLLLGVIFAILVTIDAVAQSKFVYVNNGGTLVNEVSGFSVGASGILTPVAGSPFPTGAPSVGFGNDIEVSSAGNLLFVSNDRDVNGPSVSAFSINPVTGFLTLVAGSPFATGTGIVGGLSLELTPGNQFLIAANSATGRIAVFSVGSNGALAAVPGSPFVASNNQIGPIKISSDGQFLFVALDSSPRIAAFSIGSNGALTPVAGSPFPAETEREIVSIDFNCDGTLLFAACETGEGAVFSVGSNGTCSLLPGSPFMFSFTGPQQLVLSPNNNLLFVSNTTAATVSTFSVSSTGILSLVPGSTVFIGDSNNEDRRPIDLEINQEGSLLYVMSADSTILVMSIAANGLLTVVPGSPFVNPGGSGFGATLAAFPPKTCPTSPAFDLCIQDDSNRNILKINSTTGDYQLSSCDGPILGGTGILRIRGCTIVLEDSRADRRVIVKIDTCSRKGTASLQVFSLGRTFTIIDRNITNNTCACT